MDPNEHSLICTFDALLICTIRCLDSVDSPKDGMAATAATKDPDGARTLKVRALFAMLLLLLCTARGWCPGYLLSMVGFVPSYLHSLVLALTSALQQISLPALSVSMSLSIAPHRSVCCVCSPVLLLPFRLPTHCMVNMRMSDCVGRHFSLCTHHTPFPTFSYVLLFAFRFTHFLSLFVSFWLILYRPLCIVPGANLLTVMKHSLYFTVMDVQPAACLRLLFFAGLPCFSRVLAFHSRLLRRPLSPRTRHLERH